MPMRRFLVFLLLVFLPALNGCGGSAESPTSTPTAPTSVGIVVAPGTVIITDETGLAATISISLSSPPTADVTFPVNSSNTSEGTVNKDSLVFTSANWSTSQTITITGANDTLTDGNQSYNILLGPAVSTDASYSGLQQYITATNLEVRAASFVVSPISGDTWESGVSATFTVRLGSVPTADVTLPIQSSTPTEGTPDKAALTFTTLNWEEYQTVTVTGVNDAIPDGDQNYIIKLGPAISTDSVYNNVDPDDLSVTNRDVKTGSFDITSISSNTDESGLTATFKVKLLSQPAAEVTIPVSSSDPSEGTVDPPNLTFTSANWNQYKTVTVIGVNDNLADGNQSFSIILGLTASNDDNFNGLNLNPVEVTNVDLIDPFGVNPRISAGAYHNLVLANDGTVWGWGACGNQLDATPITCPPAGFFGLPQQLNITRATAVSAGYSFSVIVKADGTVWTSGVNEFGQLGHATGSPLAQVDVLTNVRTVAAGTYHVLALKNDGSVWAWGKNSNGQLGSGVISAVTQTPVQATGGLNGKTVTAIAAGEVHSLALVDNDAMVYSWGADGYGQLGDGDGITDNPIPTVITLLNNVSTIAAGTNQSFAVGNNSGQLGAYGWGLNCDFSLGASGTGSCPDSSTPELKVVPTLVNNFSDINSLPSRLDGGSQHSLALVGSNVYAWGDNDDGEQPIESWTNLGALGNGTTSDSNSPVATSFAASAIDINAGYNYSLVMLSDGRIESSGMNDFAQLGTNEVDPGPANYTANPVYVEDPGDVGKGTSIPFYAYRPILSGQPATSTTSTSASITVCSSTLAAPANCGPITHYTYSTDNGISWSTVTSTGDSNKITLSSLPTGTVSLWVKGMTDLSSAIQTNASAVKVSWAVVAP